MLPGFRCASLGLLASGTGKRASEQSRDRPSLSNSVLGRPPVGIFYYATMSNTLDEEELAKAWLRERGYECFRPTELSRDHRAWLPHREKGQENPDFWAESGLHEPNGLWAEVKTIAPDDWEEALTKFSRSIDSVRIPDGLRGWAHMRLHPDAIEQSVQSVLKNFESYSPSFVGQKILLVFLQKTRDCRQEYQVDIAAETPIKIWARAEKLPLNPGFWLKDHLWYAPAQLRTPDGRFLTGPTFQFFSGNKDGQCVLEVHLDPEREPLDSFAVSSGGRGQATDRTVKHLKKANRQIKTACKTCDAPGVAILIPGGKFGVTDYAIQAAVYGVLRTSFSVDGAEAKTSRLFHGENGVFRLQKNRHISAAILLHPKATATVFPNPNPYALQPIPENAPLFAGASRANVQFVYDPDNSADDSEWIQLSH